MQGHKFFLTAAMLLATTWFDGVLASSAGCVKTPTLRSGTHSINVGNQQRQYRLKPPGNYNNVSPYRLVFGFHWVGRSMADVATGQTVTRDVWSYYGLQRLANNSAIFVAPQGIGNGWSNSGGGDITFVDAMVKTIAANLCVNEKLRFATGFSFSGAMSFSLACSRAKEFRAVAVLSGGQLSGCSGGTDPIAYLGIHGIRDITLSIGGGRQMRDRFVRNNGCSPTNAPEPAQGSRTHMKTVYTGCSEGHPVT